MIGAQYDQVRMDFDLAVEAYRTITEREPPGNILVELAWIMDGQARAALGSVSPVTRVGIASLFPLGMASDIVVVAPCLPGGLITACDWLLSRDLLIWLPPHAIILQFRHHAWVIRAHKCNPACMCIYIYIKEKWLSLLFLHGQGGQVSSDKSPSEEC